MKYALNLCNFLLSHRVNFNSSKLLKEYQRLFNFDEKKYNFVLRVDNTG